MISQSLIDAVEWVVNATLVTSVLFPLGTLTFWPWWQTSWGWNLIALDLALGVAVFPEVLEFDFGLRDVALFTWVQVTALSLVILTMAWRTVMIYRAQKNGAAGRHERGGASPRKTGTHSGTGPGQTLSPGEPRS